MRRLDLMEDAIRSNSSVVGTTPRSRVVIGSPVGKIAPDSPARDVGQQEEATVPVFPGRICGNGTDGEPELLDASLYERGGDKPLVDPVPHRSGAHSGAAGTGYLEVLGPLIAISLNLCALMKDELRYFVPVREGDWPLPRGYRTRIAASYLAWVYSHAKSAAEYFALWEHKHSLADCYAVKVFRNVCLKWDRRLRLGQIKGWCQWVETEYDCRLCLSLELAMRKVSSKADWCRPKNTQQNQNWKSKVDWLAADRVDPQSVEEVEEFQHEELTEETRKHAEKDATLINARKRLEEIGEQPGDRLNP